MGLVKCPRCELNYILDGGDLCTVCRKEVRGESEQDEITELCSECGENPAVPGGELCAACLKEMSRRMSEEDEDDTALHQGELSLESDSVATMDEIAIDIDEPMEKFDGEEDFPGEEDDEDEEEDEDDLADGDEPPAPGRKRS